MPSYTVTRPSWFSSELELREGNRVIGTLSMLKKWSYALAEARIGGRPVRFGYAGWSMRDTFVRDASDREIGAARTLSWWKNDVSLVLDGKEYLWKQKDWWGSEFAWYVEGKETMALRSRWGMKHFADVDVAGMPDGTGMTLLFFGLYLLTLYQMNAGATAAV